jgi:hypothetical protein
MASGKEAALLGLGVGLLGIVVAGAASRPVARPQRRRGRETDRPVRRALAAVAPTAPDQPTVKAARRLNRAAGILAFSVLADSAIEHYRGASQSRAMYTPLVTSALSLAASAHGVADQRVGAHWLRDIVYSIAAATGLVGTGFHVYNVTSRPGRIMWQNLFYGAPLGAPAAISLSGLLGYAAERVRENEPGTTPTIFGLPAGRTLAALTGGGLLATSAEAALLHFRGAFHDPFMFVPVTLPPATAALMADTALGPRRRDRRLVKWALRATAAAGFIGSAFHAFGIARNMGGWRNWSQNVLNGPPVPAPPSFAGLALAGLAALGLLEDHPDA